MPRSAPLLVLLACFLAAGGARSASADEWAQFRGGSAAGVVREGELPNEWGRDDNIAWTADVPGVGWSQPIAWGGRVFVTTAEADEQPKPDPADMSPGFEGRGLAALFSEARPPQITIRFKVYCLDAATGEVQWERTAREGQPAAHIHPNNTYATETPATDGTFLIASFGMNGVYCFDLDGEPLWSKDFGAFPTQFGWGTASSPVLLDGVVYLQCDNDQESFLVALDAATGDERWRVPREEATNWATPYVWRNPMRTELVVAGGGRMRSYDPATGDVLWEMNGYGRTATTPVGDERLLYVDSYNRLTGTVGVLAAIRPGASGDISLQGDATTNDHVAWSLSFAGNRIASPLVYDDCLYVLDNRGGVVRCLDAATGQEHYRKRLPGASGFTASPWAAAGRVYCLDADGRTTVIEAGPELKVVASNDLGEMCWGSPGVAGGRILLRTVERLYAIGE